MSAAALAGLLDRIADNTISGKIAKQVFEAMWQGNGDGTINPSVSGLMKVGDKTQLATVLFASKPSVSLVTVFVGASLALILSSLLAVAAGSVIAEYVNPRYLSYVAGAGFIVIGIIYISFGPIRAPTLDDDHPP